MVHSSKLITTLLGITASLLSFATNAEESTTPPRGVYLDQSQGVLFDTFSSNTFALQLLQIKNKFNLGDVVLGGSSQFDLQHWQGDEIKESPLGNTYQQGNGLYWTQASLDLMANVSAWSTAFASVSDNQIGRSDAGANSIDVPHAFVVWGNLNKAPFYVTTGINSIPFGVFSGSGPWDTPLTAAYFSPAQAPQVSVGFNKKSWNAAVTGFEDQTNYENHFAYTLSYTHNSGTIGYSLGAGYLTSLKTNATSNWFTRAGTIRPLPSINIGDLGAIVDLNASVQYRQVTLAGEYDKGSKNLNGNNHDPSAYAITANYAPTIAGQTTTFGFTRSVALHLHNVTTSLPGYDTLSSTFAGLADTWAVNVSRPILKNTWLGLDFQRATTNPSLLQTAAHTYTVTLDLVTYL